MPGARLAPDLLVLDTRVRFVGDEVAAVAADDIYTTHKAAALVQVEYRPVAFVTDPVKVLEAGAPSIHPNGNLVIPAPLALQRGDIEAGFAAAYIVLEETYTLPTHSATPLEPRAALPAWDGNRLTVWKSTRGIHVNRAALAHVLGIELSLVRVVGPNRGGGYGNKDESRMAVRNRWQGADVSGIIDVGEGAVTVLAQLAAEALGVGYNDVQPLFANTDRRQPDRRGRRYSRQPRLHRKFLWRSFLRGGS